MEPAGAALHHDQTLALDFPNAGPRLFEEIGHWLEADLTTDSAGDEGDAFCQQFNQPFWKTIRVKNSQSLKAINNFSSADAILLETFSDSSYGGTGKVFDWDLLNNISLEQGYVLAGGINSENIKKAVSMNPWCIDVNSGVESSVALKDKALMDEIIKNINNG